MSDQAEQHVESVLAEQRQVDAEITSQTFLQESIMSKQQIMKMKEMSVQEHITQEQIELNWTKSELAQLEQQEKDCGTEQEQAKMGIVQANKEEQGATERMRQTEL